jgi:hypothetical protein
LVVVAPAILEIQSQQTLIEVVRLSLVVLFQLLVVVLVVQKIGPMAVMVVLEVALALNSVQVLLARQLLVKEVMGDKVHTAVEVVNAVAVAVAVNPQ